MGGCLRVGGSSVGWILVTGGGRWRLSVLISICFGGCLSVWCRCIGCRVGLL
jgi:hypothetical protein